jgi:hypothetical protein
LRDQWLFEGLLERDVDKSQAKVKLLRELAELDLLATSLELYKVFFDA